MLIRSFALLLVTTSLAAAQAPAGVASGVVFKSSGEPVAAAAVEVIGTRWRTVTAFDGSFRLTLTPGTWRLRATHIGFTPDTIPVVVESATSQLPALTFHLKEAVASLAGITVEATGAPPMSRSVTRETVRQVPPLGEPDVFRAIALQPGVSQPNDITGRLHLAGGASDETAVTLDGYPLQQPFHLFGVLGVFNIAALERADVLIHHVPASVSGGLSGVIDLQTRQPASEAKEAVISLMSSSLTVNRPTAGRGTDLLFSGRVTYLDKLMLAILSPTKHHGEDLPLIGYEDVIVRAGRSLGSRTRAELLGFGTRDHLRSFDAVGAKPLTWGEGLLGARIMRTGVRWDATARVSLDRAFASDDNSRTGAVEIDNRRDATTASVITTRKGVHWLANAGIAIDRRQNSYNWRRESGDDLLGPDLPAFIGRAGHTETAVFTEVSRDLGRLASITLGVRAPTLGSGWYAGPRALLEVRPFGATVQASVERRHQFTTEASESREGNVAPPVFLLDRPRSVDAASLAVEPGLMRVGEGAIKLRAEGFARSYHDRVRVVGDTSAAATLRFARLDGTSRGASFSAVASWPGGGLVQAAYTWMRTRETDSLGTFRTIWDTPHDVSIFGAIPFRGPWSVTAAYRGRSGQAITPVTMRVFVPLFDAGSLNLRFIDGPRNSASAGPYHRLDIGLRRNFTTRRLRGTWFIQAINVLNHQNVLAYEWLSATKGPNNEAIPTDASRGGLPILPSLGVELRW